MQQQGIHIELHIKLHIFLFDFFFKDFLDFKYAVLKPHFFDNNLVPKQAPYNNEGKKIPYIQEIDRYIQLLHKTKILKNI